MSRRMRAFFQNAARSLPRHHMTAETIIGGNIVAADGSMGKMVRLGGLRTMAALSDYDAFISRLANQAASALNSPGHAIQMYFARDPSFAKLWAHNLVRPMRAAAEFFGIDLSTYITNREELLAGRVIPEVAYAVLWTRPSALDPREVQALEQEVQRPAAWPGAENAQDIWTFSTKLETVHNSWWRDLFGTLTRSGVPLVEMSNDEIITAIRASVHPTKADMTVSAWMPGDVPPPGSKPLVKRGDMPAVSASTYDISGDLWPRLNDIVFDGADANILSADRARIGNTVWASYEMSRGPLDQQPFAALLTRVRQDEEIPWRASILITTDVLPQVGLKSVLAKLTGITSDASRMLNAALEASREEERTGRRPVGIQMIFSTWASTAEEASKRGTIDIRAGRLQRSIEGWGGCLTSAGGDPLAMTLGGALGINPASPASRGIVPHDAALRFLPFDRTSSPLTSGSLTFLTESDTPYPWDIGTSLQNSAAEFYSGMPGQGKSNLASTMIMSYILSSATVSKMADRRLPLLGVIDIGYSQVGQIETLRAALPPHRVDEAQYHHLLNTPDYAINPLDTQPGLREPIDIERTFLINFLTALITPVGVTTPPPRLSELCGAVIDQAYREFSDAPSAQGKPRLYTRGYDREVDYLIDKIGLTPDEGTTTWWDIVDAFHYLGTEESTDAAILAQRNAVPRLSDLSKILTDNAIESVWRDARDPNTSESLVSMFRLSLSTVASEYRILSGTTRFRLGEGRVVVLDLGGILSGEGAAAAKMSSIMYMLARSVLTRGYYLTDDMLAKAPELWREWHTRRVRLYREAPKRLLMDEYHKTKNARGVRDQLITDIREGRKWGVAIQVLSQMISDFDREALELATSVYILGVGNAEAQERIRTMYNLSDAAVERLGQRLGGPTPRGAPFLVLHVTKQGRLESFLYNIKSPYELWADSTSPGAVAIRTRVAAVIGFPAACIELARRFPSGDSKNEEERLLRSNPNANVIAEITDEIIRIYEKRQAA